MANGIAGIDHVIVGVRDLEHARMGWTRLGFTLTPRGRHLGQGTANYCIMFARDYLELLGVVERDEHAQRLEAFLARREGPMAVTLQPERCSGSTTSASNATIALRVATASLPLRSVLMMMSPLSSAKLTSSTAGRACRV